MHPVKAVPTRYNPFVNGEKTHSSIKPVKTQKNPLGWAFKKRVFLNPVITFHQAHNNLQHKQASSNCSNTD